MGWESSTLKASAYENYMFRTRAIVAGLFAFLCVGILVGRLVYLQVLHHDHYTTLSDNNRISIRPIAPTRGLIFDRNGVVLAENLPSFSVEIIPEQVSDMEATLALIGERIPLTERDLTRFERTRKRLRRFDAVLLRDNLTEEEVAALAVDLHRLPGVEVQARLTRHYPLGPLTAHSVGYVGRINEKELKTLDPGNYSATRYIGKVGIERSYEDVLHGTVGHEEVETDARGRVLRVLKRTPPIPGKDLILNLDIRLHEAAMHALEGRRGALVAIEPSSGAVRAMVSTPSFDPNLFVDGIDVPTYQELTGSLDKPLFNRALRGQYPPGSTIKPLVGLAGLEMGVVEPEHSLFCPGWYQLKGDDHYYRDWKRVGHGPVNLYHAIAESCDIYFYDLAYTLGIDRLSDYLKGFGLGHASGLDITGELPGLMPDRAWKRAVRNEPWFPGETLIAGIGQGFVLSTPVQLASAIATFANNGVGYEPRVVSTLLDAETRAREPLEPTLGAQVTVVDPHHWHEVVMAMRGVIHGPTGTARRLAVDLPYEMAGKTGTAQVFGIAQGERYKKDELDERLHDHALFVAFAPVEKPQLAVAVIVENGGSGGAVAGPVARAVLNRYLLDDEAYEAIEHPENTPATEPPGGDHAH